MLSEVSKKLTKQLLSPFKGQRREENMKGLKSLESKSVEDKQECIIEFRNRIEHPVVIWLTRCVQCGGVSVKGCECSGNFSLKTCVFINKNLFVI